MKAIILDPATNQLLIKEIPIPVPGKGEVLIKITAAPINPSDTGRINLAQQNSEFLSPGIEGSGTVMGTGGGLLGRAWMGKRVACTSSSMASGTWAEYMVTGAARCFPLPEKVSDEQGAMHFVNPLTALAFFKIVSEEKHRGVVSLAASSALGKMINWLGQEKKIPVINIVRSNIQKKILEKSGTPNVIDSSEPDFLDQFNSLCTHLHATLLLDPIGGQPGEKLLEIMPYKSTALVYGTLSGETSAFNPRILIADNKNIRGFYLASWLQERGLLNSVRMLLSARHLLTTIEPVKIRSRIGLEEVPEAINSYLEEMSAGKMIIYPHGFST